jgi:hypothetical protein
MDTQQNPPAPSMPPIPTTEEGGTPPPMPAGIGPASPSQGGPAPQTPIQSGQNPVSDSSAAPGFDIPPVITTPKKKFGGGKIIATILGLLLLVGGIGAGVVLVQQRQLFQQKAATQAECGGTCSCVNTSGYPTITSGTCTAGAGGSACGCKCPSGSVVSSNNCQMTKLECTPGQTSSCAYCGTKTCNSSGSWGSCIGQGVCSPGSTSTSGCTGGGTKTCNNSCQWESCIGGTTVTKKYKCSGTTCVEDDANGTYTSSNCDNACTSSNYPCKVCSGSTCVSSGNTPCTKNLNQCETDTECSERTCSGKGPSGGTMDCSTREACSGTGKIPHSDIKCTGTYAICCETLPAGSTDQCAGVGCSGNTCTATTKVSPCYVDHYWCKIRSPDGCSSNLIESGVQSSSFSKDCGTEQMDIYCPTCGAGANPSTGGKYLSKTYDSDCGGGGELNAQCQAIKVYDTSWNQLTAAQLSNLTAGSVIRFAVSGTATSGTFDKAQFTVNGTALSETTTKKPGTEEFYSEYTIPDGITSFTITGKVHHSTLGWF